jgi:hypothetical protein
VVNVKVDAVNNLNAYQFRITYNNSVIQLIPGDQSGLAITKGLIGSTDIPVSLWAFSPPGTPGNVEVIGTLLNSQSQVSGSGYLAQLHFMVVATATAALPGRLAFSSRPTGQGQPFVSNLYDLHSNAISMNWTSVPVSIAITP